MNGKKIVSGICCALLLVTSQLVMLSAHAEEENTPPSSALQPDLISLADTDTLASTPLLSTAAQGRDDALEALAASKPTHLMAAAEMPSSTRIALSGSSTLSTALTPGAIEAAELLGITPYVQRVMAMRQGAAGGEFGKMSDEELALRVELMDRILGEILEVRVCSDRIDRELSWAWANKGILEAKKQKMLNTLFTFNFMQGGVLGICSGPEFLHGQNKAGTELLLLASSIGLGLSFASFAVQRSQPSRKIDNETTMLADVFGLNYTGQLHHPERVLKFLNSVPPGSTTGKTRKDELITSWQRGKYLRSMEEKNLLKLASVQPAADKYHENISLIANRIRLLYDSQWTMEQLDAELLDLLRALD